jgi:hypothetical protein
MSPGHRYFDSRPDLTITYTLQSVGYIIIFRTRLNKRDHMDISTNGANEYHSSRSHDTSACKSQSIQTNARHLKVLSGIVSCTVGFFVLEVGVHDIGNRLGHYVADQFLLIRFEC